MMCPICMREDYVQSSGDTHYICVKKEELPREETGCGTQFVYKEDGKLRYPHSVIFKKRKITDFYRYDFLNIKKMNAIDG